MKWLEVKPSGPISGTIRIQGSKNSSLGLLAASCLSEQKVSFSNVPNIRDTRIVADILKSIGAEVKHEKDTFIIDPTEIHIPDINTSYSGSIRTAYYFIGALLAKQKKVTVGYPGGDNFVTRPIDQHLKGFRALGAKITLGVNNYTVEAPRLKGAEIYFDVVTSGATVNIMMAAALAKGRTVLYNAARDPEVVDMAVFLNKMGARIYGAGTDTIRIIGVEGLNGCSHAVIPDRLTAGAFLIAAGVAEGKVTVENIEPEHLVSCMEKLREVGILIERADNSVTAVSTGKIRATRVRAAKYPAFETDFQQPMTTLLLKAQGRSTISDRVYPYRFSHCEQLKRMGADITVKKGIARINSHQKLKGSWVHADDIRAGICLVLAGMMAEGITCITGVEHIERGYEDIVSDFQRLGADIRMVDADMSEMVTENKMV